MAAGASAEDRARTQREKARRLEASAERWERGAEGERKTASFLEPLAARGYVVLHDLAVPGSNANIDHVVIGPSGVTVVDSKAYRARLTINKQTLWAGRYPQTRRLEALAFEVGAVQRCVDRVAPEMSVRSVVCVHGVDVPADPDGALGAVVLCGPEELDAVVTELEHPPLPPSLVATIATAVETTHPARAGASSVARPPAPPVRSKARPQAVSASTPVLAAVVSKAARQAGLLALRIAVAIVGAVLCVAVAGQLLESFGSGVASYGTTTTTPVVPASPSPSP